MNKLAQCITRFVSREDAVTSMEYALVAVLIAVACLAAATAVGTQIAAFYTRLSDAITAIGW